MSDFTEWDLRKLHVDDNRLEALREAYEHLALHPSDNYKTSGGERVPSDAEHASLFAELQGHRENLCRQCNGQTTIPNPAANYTEDYADGRRTGQYSTNDPEEIECPLCDGHGYEKPARTEPPRLHPTYDDEVAF